MNINKSFYRPVWAEIDHSSLRHNFKAVQKTVGKKVGVLCVIKANAYGHGIVSVGKTLSDCGAQFLGVTSIEEALQLRAAKIKSPPLILGNSFPFESLELAIKNQVRVTVASVESARICSLIGKKLKRKVYAHAKIDTGMHRIGVQAARGTEFVQEILRLPNLELEGIYTHFSGSAEDPNFTAKQLELFDGLVKNLRGLNINITFTHCANSAAIVKYKESHYNLVRSGIALYGAAMFAESATLKLRPVLSWKSSIVFIKDLPAGSPVSYAGTYVTRRATRLATCAFGYADGFRRSLSSNSYVLVRGHRAPVLGRVTMDMTMIDVTDIPFADVGDEVVLIGSQKKQIITASDMARWANTSSYEILCGIASRVPRVDLKE